MWVPKYTLKDLSAGSGSIVGIHNIEEFLNHVSKYEKIGEKSLAELVPDYETAMACLVQMVKVDLLVLIHSCNTCFLNFMKLRMVKKETLFLRPCLENLHMKL